MQALPHKYGVTIGRQQREFEGGGAGGRLQLRIRPAKRAVNHGGGAAATDGGQRTD